MLSLRYEVWRRRNPEARLSDPLFLIGCPRSGTTIAVELFGSHPDVANWSEAGRIWDPVDFWNPEADHCWGTERVNPAEESRLHGRFEHFRQMRNKERFINKHPRCTVRIDFIQRIFPDARFIHLIRDGRAVVNSILTKTKNEPERHSIPFGHFCKPPNWRDLLREDPAEQAALQWKEILNYVLAKKEMLGDRYFELRYEDLCKDPRFWFEKMYTFSGLPATEAALANIPAALQDMGYKWRQQLTSAQIETVNSVQAELLEKLGYSV